MKRILEPEYMDTVEEAESYQGMDHSAANQSLADRFHAIGGGRGLVLDIGTGPGDIPVLLTREALGLSLVAVDAAREMLRLARRSIESANLTGRIALHCADAKRLPYSSDVFDGVYSNTILHHIPEPTQLLAEAWRVLKPGGVLLIRDLYRPDSEKEAWRLVDLHAAGADKAQRQLLFDSLHAALTVEEAREAVHRAGIRGARVEMSSDRHYTVEVEA
jgi:ubiquinone/menaquinone biosynthesis C-methylase UbiE